MNATIEYIREQQKQLMYYLRGRIQEEMNRMRDLYEESDELQERDVTMFHFGEGFNLEWISDRAGEHKSIEGFEIIEQRGNTPNLNIDNGSDTYFHILDEIDNIDALLWLWEKLSEIKDIDDLEGLEYY
jgi:hypothetical protein